MSFCFGGRTQHGVFREREETGKIFYYYLFNTERNAFSVYGAQSLDWRCPTKMHVIIYACTDQCSSHQLQVALGQLAQLRK